MRTQVRVWRVAATASCAFLIAGWVSAAGTSTPPATTAPKPPVKTWVVVAVLSPKSVVAYEAVASTGVADRRARLLREYKLALEKWKKDKQLAQVNSKPFKDPKPVRGYVKRVLTTPSSFRYQDVARAEAAVLARRAKEGAAPPGTAAEDEGEAKPHLPPTGKVVTPPESDDNNTETAGPKP